MQASKPLQSDKEGNENACYLFPESHAEFLGQLQQRSVYCLAFHIAGNINQDAQNAKSLEYSIQYLRHFIYATYSFITYFE